MQAKHELHTGKQTLAEILGSFPAESAHWNEAQNRFQFIDRLLIDCLGWERPNMEVEHTLERARADYMLGSPARAILEAKREAVRFDFPPSGKGSLTRPLKSILEASSEAKEALAQVQSYCSVRGVPIGVVCNGPQLIIFQAITVSASPFEGAAFVFDGFGDYLERFPLLWKLLSPEGLQSNYARRSLAATNFPRLPPKASQSIPEPKQYRYKDGFHENLQRLASLLLVDIEQLPEVKPSFYKECYVSTVANNRHLLLSSKVLANWYERSDSIATGRLSIGAVDESGQLQLDSDILTEAMSARPIVVLGDVGVGKTSFFENLFHSLEETSTENSILVHINLGIQGATSESLRFHVLDSISKAIREQADVNISSSSFARSVYYREVIDFQDSVYGYLRQSNPADYETRLADMLAAKIADRSNHIQACLGHLSKGQGYRVVVVIDNADQRSYEIQQEAFIIAQEFASFRNCLVFVALRPSTFHISTRQGALSGYQNRVFTISPPPAEDVILKRLTFAARVADGQIAPEAIENLKLNLKSVVLFIEAMLRSIRTNQDIRTFLNNISGGNMRVVVDLVNGFFGSPNVDSQKIVNIEAETHRYLIPLHEFGKHALLGEYSYYNPDSSQVACNLFDTFRADRREHFLRSLIVSFLLSDTPVRNKDGLVYGGDIMDEMRALRFDEEQVKRALAELARRRLISTPNEAFREIEPGDETPSDFHFRPTSIGAYHVREWFTTFGFLDAMSTDTPIMDEESRDSVAKIASSFDIGDRLRKAKAFRRYLSDSWQDADIAVGYFDFEASAKRQDQSFEDVAKAVSRPHNKSNKVWKPRSLPIRK